MSEKYIAISDNGEVDVHATSSDGSYSSLCGLDEHDPGIGLETVPLPKNPKVTCPQCIATIRRAKQYRLPPQPADGGK